MASRFRRALVDFLDEIFEFIRDVIALILKSAAVVLIGLVVALLALAFCALFVAIFVGVFRLLSLFFHPIAAALVALLLAMASMLVYI